jgi:hypothetical protein
MQRSEQRAASDKGQSCIREWYTVIVQGDGRKKAADRNTITYTVTKRTLFWENDRSG